jgi:hypothetical protein
MHLYASWNGATQVASWEVLAGSDRHHMIPITARSWNGFETAMHVYNEPPFLAVQALDGNGHALRRSYVVPTPAHAAIFGDRVFASTSSRVADVPVACFAHDPCRLTIHVSAGNASLGPSTSVTLHSGRLALVPFKLSTSGLRTLTRARQRQLSVRVSASRPSGRGVIRHVTLAAYSVSGPGPARALIGSPTVRLLGSSEFVSSRGGGGILAACYGPVPCSIKATISVGHTIIASPGVQFLGADEAGYIGFRLTSAGRSMLSHASGNQLAARVTLSNQSAVARGRVALIRYG